MNMKAIIFLLLLCGNTLAAPLFIKKGQVYFEEKGMSFKRYGGTKVKLTVLEIDKKSNWVLFERSFGKNKEKIWMNTNRMPLLVMPAKSNNN